MALEISEFELILSVIVAFIAGLGGLFLLLKVYPLIRSKTTSAEPTSSERLEYYEKQLIDIKIRLDAMEMQSNETDRGDYTNKAQELEIQQSPKESEEEITQTKPDLVNIEPEIVQESQRFVPKIDISHHTNPIDVVLHLITDKRMTSRDIQITLSKSREHTSRLMKKLFEEGYVQRHEETRPFTYSIAEKGLERIRSLENDTQTV